MTAEILLYHLRELGVVVTLGDGARTLELEAPCGVLTGELAALLREHRDELIELVYAEAERAAIAEFDGRPSLALVHVESPAVATPSVFSPAQALERARALADDQVFKPAPGGGAAWNMPDDVRARMEATLAP